MVFCYCFLFLCFVVFCFFCFCFDGWLLSGMVILRVWFYWIVVEYSVILCVFVAGSCFLCFFGVSLGVFSELFSPGAYCG